MLEVDVHSCLRTMMRAGMTPWPHQLTLARMVARGLRLQRPALIQVPGGEDYHLSYVLPALMGSEPVIICAPPPIQQRLMHQVLPMVQGALPLRKPVIQAEHWPLGFQGVLLVDPVVWFRDRALFPASVPVIIDQAEHCEAWVQTALTQTLTAVDWHHLAIACPGQAGFIRQVHLDLTVSLQRRAIAQPLLLADELAVFEELWQRLAHLSLPPAWEAFRRHSLDPHWALWAQCGAGQVQIYCSPVILNELLATQVWAHQPLVLIGTGLDWQRDATNFRDRLGLPPLTTLQFLPDRRDQGLPCLLPSLPAPNSPLFQPQLLATIKQLICETPGAIAIVLSDQPLQTQLATALSAEFGSRVRLNLPVNAQSGIGIWDWDVWLAGLGGQPDLLIIPTLPFPSLEAPLIAAHVQWLKAQRRDWFREYLLPIAASRLIRAIAPLQQSSLAILDSRLQRRQYGQQMWSALQAYGVYWRQ